MGSVGEAEQNRIRDIRVAEEKAMTERGVTKSTLELKTSLNSQERDMRLSVAIANAEAISGENESRAKVQLSNAELKVKMADAHRLGELKHVETEGAILEAKANAAQKVNL
jgi:flotillin